MSIHEEKILISPAQDELGRSTLVGLISKAIKAKVKTPHGPLTFGIYGMWGGRKDYYHEDGGI